MSGWSVMKIYQDDSGWRVGDDTGNQVSQIFPSEETAKNFVENRLISRASFDRMMKYPGKIIPVEWLMENHANAQYLCARCGHARSDHPVRGCAAYAVK